MSDEKIEEFLEHFGVKGMHWGVRNIENRLDQFRKNRELNKVSKQRELVKLSKQHRPPNRTSFTNRQRKDDIQRARDRIESGAARAESKLAKQQYKKDKQTIGSRAARKILNQKREALWKDEERSKQTKDGAEAVARILSDMSKAQQQAKRERDISRLHNRNLSTRDRIGDTSRFTSDFTF